MLAGIEGGCSTEAFCMGTAAVIMPIGRIGHHGRDAVVGGGAAGPVATYLCRALTDIQYRRVEDPYGWTRVVDADSGSGTAG